MPKAALRGEVEEVGLGSSPGLRISRSISQVSQFFSSGQMENLNQRASMIPTMNRVPTSLNAPGFKSNKPVPLVNFL